MREIEKLEYVCKILVWLISQNNVSLSLPQKQFGFSSTEHSLNLFHRIQITYIYI